VYDLCRGEKRESAVSHFRIKIVESTDFHWGRENSEKNYFKVGLKQKQTKRGIVVVVAMEYG
jgi:hypothetical protein